MDHVPAAGGIAIPATRSCRPGITALASPHWLHRTGDKVTIVSAGVTLFEALKAADQLKADGINVTVIDAYSIKPLGKKEILAAAKKTNNTVITVEDHYSEGGLGDAVAGELSVEGIKVHKLAVVGMPHSGKAEELLAKFGIDAAGIIKKVKSL